MTRSRSKSRSRSPGSRRVFTERGRRSRSRSPRDRRRGERRRSRSRSPRKFRRSRSASPRRYRRSPSPRRRRSRSRSRSPRHSRRSRSRSPAKEDNAEQENNMLEDMNLDMDDPNQEEEAMMKLMGFGSFDSTKGKHVEGSCNMSGISTKKPRKYRQYMNRKGGFNRPLDYVM